MRKTRVAGFFVPCALFILSVSLLCGGIASAAGKAGEFAIVYTTDAHGRIVTDADTIGLDVVAAIYRATPHAVLLDAGDFLHGAPIATLTRGRDVIDLMKRAGYLAAAVGNHEFNYGRDVLLERAAQASLPPRPMHLLAANVTRGDGQRLFEPWLVTERNGLRLGIFGLTTPDTTRQAAPSAVAGLAFGDPLAAAKEAVRALERQGCDLIIAITHLETDESRRIADEVAGIDIVLGGHSHVVIDEVRNGTIVLSSGEYGRHVGVFAVRRGADGSLRAENRLISKAESAAYGSDPFLALKIDTILAEQRKILGKVVAHSDVDLIGDKLAVRTGETNLGNLTADAMIAAAGAEVGIMNGGSIRATIARGAITRGDVLTAFPYSNIVVSKRVTGAQLKDILEAGFSELPDADGCFPQIGGMTVRLRPDAAPGARLVAVALADGTPVDDAGSYLLAVNDFLAEGGDGYPHLRDLPIERQGMSVDEAFLDYVGEFGTAAYETAEPARIFCESPR